MIRWIFQNRFRIRERLSLLFSPHYRVRSGRNRLLRANPLTAAPKADKETYRALARAASEKDYSEVDRFEEECGYSIDRAWLDELALHTQIVVKKSPLCYAHGRVLYSALSRYLDTLELTESVNIVETGTARGFSSLCMARALQDKASDGKIVTLDILPHRFDMYWNCIDDLEGKKTRQKLLMPWKELVERYLVFLEGESRDLLPRVCLDRVHFAFFDGAHTGKDVSLEFQHVTPSQRPGDIVIFDDYTPQQFPEIVSSVDQICVSKRYSPTVICAHQGRGYLLARKN